MMNGIGGSVIICVTVSLRFFNAVYSECGSISSVVPMVTHADHTEHDTMVFITEQGVADIRGLSPVKRAKAIINNCAHPDFGRSFWNI